MHQDEKALNSSVVNACKLDYPVTFRDAQDLELVRRKLLKASLILRSSVDVGRSLKTHIEEVARTLQQSKSQDSLVVLDQYAASLGMHARIVDALLERLSGTSRLVSHTRPCWVKVLCNSRIPDFPYTRISTWRERFDDGWGYSQRWSSYQTAHGANGSRERLDGRLNERAARRFKVYQDDYISSSSLRTCVFGCRKLAPSDRLVSKRWLLM